MRKLLKESDIRQMMKLANIPGLSDGFINKLNETSIYEQDEDDPTDVGGDVPPPDDAAVMGEPEAAEEPEGLGMDDLGDAPADVGGATVESTLDGLGAFLEGMSDPEVAAEVAPKIQVDKTDEDPGMDEPEPEGEEGGEDLAGLESPPGDEAAGLDEPDTDLELAEANLELEEDESVVNEVVRRVAKRLLKTKR
jgi:hypothetical protein